MDNQKMTICLWFDDQAEEAALYYKGIFNNFSIGRISRYGKEGFEHHQKQEGSLMTIEFSINGMNFLGLNGGNRFSFNEATSLMVHCDTQDEIDHLWEKLTHGGQEGPCGWLKDRFGVSWQIVPNVFTEILACGDQERIERVTGAFLKMKKPFINDILQSFND